MPRSANIVIHPSQFPESVRRDLVESLRTRKVNHKFHYDSFRQARKWLALHQAYSPSRRDAGGMSLYDRGFEAAARRMKARRIHVLGLGCGGGRKDTRLLTLLKAGGRDVSYGPCDVSAAMVLVARQAALHVVSERKCFPLVCDLASAEDLRAAFERNGPPRTPRVLTFFGMIPNVEPDAIVSKLAALVRRQDLLLAGANLAPGRDYAAGMKQVLPQYNNALTREWLMTFLLDLGVRRRDGRLLFRIEDDPAGSRLKRVAAHFQFSRASVIRVDEERFGFRRGDSIRLFYSYRHTPERMEALLGRHGLRVLDRWIAPSGEEGVFLAARRLYN